jgi:hypothetical protein
MIQLAPLWNKASLLRGLLSRTKFGWVLGQLLRMAFASGKEPLLRLGRSKLSVVRDGSLFLQSIIWTALTYNPVRILGLLGVAGLMLAAAVAVGW